MNILRTSSSVIFAALLPIAAYADSSSLTASVRIGLTLNDNSEVSDDFSISNFGSRIKWSGEKDLQPGLKGIGYVELGINPNDNRRGSSGADRTRQLWAGLSGGFGTAKVGAQYAAFYDLVSSHTDIAWWGSCWTQFECSRQTRVLKYSGSSGPISYAASFTGEPADESNDFADEIEYGFNYQVGSYLFGLAGTTQADEDTDKGGQLLGFVFKGNFAGAGLALTHQMADEEFADNAAEVTNTTLSASVGNAYAVFNLGDTGDTKPTYGTLGYTLNIGEGTLMYFEYQIIDDDTVADTETIVRATYKYDFST